MSRKPRMIVPGLAHHITQRGNHKQIVFEEDIDYLKYCRWMNKYAVQNGLHILAYCLMVNHVHFIVVADDTQSISKTFQMVHMRYAQYILGRRKLSGHLWQGRFYSCPMDEQHLYRAIRYVERNPVRSRMVQKAWRYPWSSAPWHVGLIKTPDISLEETALVERRDWKEYLNEEDEEFRIPPNNLLS